MIISVIAAVAQNLAIGYQNRLLYRLPNDLKRFKGLTTGHTIIMGRKTFESLPHGALPNRRNIVLSRQHITFPGVDVFPSLSAALLSLSGEDEVYIIGGASVYAESLPFVARLYLTEVENTPIEADAFFPAFDEETWVENFREVHDADERHAYRYAFVDYIKKR